MKTHMLFGRFCLGLACLAAVPWASADTHYSTNILNDAPVLYWSFDESEGTALQLAPLGPPLPVTTENDLVSVNGAGRT